MVPYATYGPGSGVVSPAFRTPTRRVLYQPGEMEAEVRAAERIPLSVGGFNFSGARDRNVEPAPYIGQKYDRGQNLSGAAGTGSTFAEIGKFAGKPDGIDLLATGGAAVVELQDRLGLNGIRFTLPVNVPFSTLVSRERVVAFNVSDASQATVIATGKWALAAPAVEGYVRANESDADVGELGLTQDEDSPEYRAAAQY